MSHLCQNPPKEDHLHSRDRHNSSINDPYQSLIHHNSTQDDGHRGPTGHISPPRQRNQSSRWSSENNREISPDKSTRRAPTPSSSYHENYHPDPVVFRPPPPDSPTDCYVLSTPASPKGDVKSEGELGGPKVIPLERNFPQRMFPALKTERLDVVRRRSLDDVDVKEIESPASPPPQTLPGQSTLV